LGSLPGNVDEKLAPYLFSTYYLIDKIIGKPAREILVEKEIIVPIALAYLRGVNLDNCILIAEEMQNSTISSFKTLLTRIGENCKMIISGDIDQIDRFRDKNQSGLFDSLNRFTYTDENGQIKSKVDGLNIFQFAPEDIVRNKIISNILDKY
jgi:phosphate starvation-inducible PhoH-like protein